MSGKNRYLFYFIFHICNVGYDGKIFILCLYVDFYFKNNVNACFVLIEDIFFIQSLPEI